MSDQCVKEIGLLFLFLIITLFVSSCGPVVIRDQAVYSAEMDFLDAAVEEQIERGIALINEHCHCETMMGVKGFTTTTCNDLAETILVLKSRMKYHTNFMRYLGGLIDKRPEKIPPEIPVTSSLCPVEPLELPDSLEFDIDAGTDGGE